MKKIISLTLISAALMSACTPTSAQNETTQTTKVSENPTKNQAPKKADGVWIDVRSADEYKSGHLSDTVNIPHEQIAAQIASVAPDKNQAIHLYCRSGRRSEIALQELKKLGYTNLHNHGGYDDLVKQGYQ